MADGFETLLANMQSMGFFQYLFPFLLALAIVYGLLHFAMGERLQKSAKGLISLIIAFFVMLYSSWNVAIVNFFANISGTFLIVASGILLFLVLLAMVGFKSPDVWGTNKAKWIVVLLVVFIAAVIFFGAGGAYFLDLRGVVNSQFLTIIFFIVILALVIFWLGNESESKGEAAAGGKKE